jgi:hypothetical protein
MSFKKKNGYYKHYNKEGKSCRIKFTCNPDNVSDKEDIIITYRNKAELTPNIIVKTGFKCDSDVIHYLLRNLDNNDMVFEIAVKYRKC